MITLFLYTSRNCHLCELARDTVKNSTLIEKLELIEIDIASDIALVRKYRHSIPVLTSKNINGELYWPFNQEDLLNWLKI